MPHSGDCGQSSRIRIDDLLRCVNGFWMHSGTGHWVNGERHRSEPFPPPAYAAGRGIRLWGDVSVWLARIIAKSLDNNLKHPTIADHALADADLVGLQLLAP